MNKYNTGVDINDWLSLWMPHENAKNSKIVTIHDGCGVCKFVAKSHFLEDFNVLWFLVAMLS